MKYPIATILLAAAVSVAAFPAPASEAEVDALRARGVSEHDIAARFPHSGHTTASILVRRHIDADGEVSPGRYALLHPRDDVEAHAGLAEDSVEGLAVVQHVHAVKDFISAVLGGRIATAGNGGAAMMRARRWGKRGVVGGGGDGDDHELLREGEEVQVQQRPARWIYQW
ncbi:uncharacterized protein BKCO1_4200069 [Diplodia corticola]|uniref:Uncharacterized protein n=1 Tax=Diplodia corticola TaxID=236234 RepID=A0A1J9RX06_9PEZI|nr:uncharacterized protein BKCO1_4200069 [Diplodia corticola]OJD32021.1 hypothetical protein BKCO1_4200069 [Diplodia corticola]